MAKHPLDKVAPEPGPCRGNTIWNLWPRRHWCRMTDEEAALYLLSGRQAYKDWDWPNHEQSWYPPFDMAFQREDGLYNIQYNSRCRWAKKSKRKENVEPMNNGEHHNGTKRRDAA